MTSLHNSNDNLMVGHSQKSKINYCIYKPFFAEL